MSLSLVLTASRHSSATEGSPAAEKWCGSQLSNLLAPWICATIEIIFAQQAQLPTADL